MDWNLALTLILGSSLIATVVTKIFDLLSERQRKRELQIEKFYAPIKFQLMLIDVSKENRQQIMEHFKTTRNEWTQNNNGADRGEITMSVIQKQAKITNPLIKQWWLYVDRLKNLIEENSQYIKSEDFQIFRKFIDSYVKREIVGKDDGGNDTPVYLPDEEAPKYMGNILEVIDEMNKKFL